MMQVTARDDSDAPVAFGEADAEERRRKEQEELKRKPLDTIGEVVDEVV